MIDLKDMQCLAALARHHHFAKAADACGVSQPAFSMRIRSMEERLGVKVVRRGNRFQGFTPDGERIVEHARRILDDVKALEQDVRTGRGEITGNLTLGVVPTAAAPAAHMAKRLKDAHPGITVRIETTTSLLVQQGVIDGKFDAGLTYVEGVEADLLTADPLFDETYVLLAPSDMVPGQSGAMSWADAASLRLCLLHSEMQNRRILDGVFRDLGLSPKVVAETSTHSAALVMAVEGLAATVVPKELVEKLGPFRGTTVFDLIEPDVAKTVGLVTPRRAKGLSVLDALKAVALTPE